MVADKQRGEEKRPDSWRSRWYRLDSDGVLEVHPGPNAVRVGKDGWNDVVKVTYGTSSQKTRKNTAARTATDERQMDQIAREYKELVKAEQVVQKQVEEEREREREMLNNCEFVSKHPTTIVLPAYWA